MYRITSLPSPSPPHTSLPPLPPPSSLSLSLSLMFPSSSYLHTEFKGHVIPSATKHTTRSIHEENQAVLGRCIGLGGKEREAKWIQLSACHLSSPPQSSPFPHSPPPRPPRVPPPPRRCPTSSLMCSPCCKTVPTRVKGQSWRTPAPTATLR